MSLIPDCGYANCTFPKCDCTTSITTGGKSEAEQRKATPIYSGVIKYFPDALAEVARASFVGNEQHHPGQPLHWDRAKSTDELDALARHLVEAGSIDTDGVRHSAKVAWRALANLQKELEADGNKQDV